MFRFRRAWLFCPLLVLTLFFAECGWRNWNLGRDEQGVRFESALYAARQNPTPMLWAIDVSPKTAELMEQTLTEEHSRSAIRVISIQSEKIDDKTLAGKSCVLVQQPQFQNLFHATIWVGFSRPSSKTSWGNWEMQELILTRSPLAFWSNRWHVTSVANLPEFID